MEIKVEIKSCKDCRHLDHSGAFTPGGARLVCGHTDAVNCFSNHKGEHRYHWNHRVVSGEDIPEKCPLLKGSKY